MNGTTGHVVLLGFSLACLLAGIAWMLALRSRAESWDDAVNRYQIQSFNALGLMWVFGIGGAVTEIQAIDPWLPIHDALAAMLLAVALAAVALVGWRRIRHPGSRADGGDHGPRRGRMRPAVLAFLGPASLFAWTWGISNAGLDYRQAAGAGCVAGGFLVLGYLDSRYAVSRATVRTEPRAALLAGLGALGFAAAVVGLIAGPAWTWLVAVGPICGLGLLVLAYVAHADAEGALPSG